MTDIVERLRQVQGDNADAREAADEIERLREPHVYVSSDRVKKLAFLFRRELANQLRKKDADLRLWPAILSSALRGDDDTNKNTQDSVDTLTMHFHPDKQQRREAAQRILDDLEFKFDSEIKRAEFAENWDAAKMMRRQISETRALMEKQVGSKLAYRETIDPTNPSKLLPPDPQKTQH